MAPTLSMCVEESQPLRKLNGHNWTQKQHHTDLHIGYKFLLSIVVPTPPMFKALSTLAFFPFHSFFGPFISHHDNFAPPLAPQHFFSGTRTIYFHTSFFHKKVKRPSCVPISGIFTGCGRCHWWPRGSLSQLKAITFPHAPLPWKHISIPAAAFFR